jgi:hypothetical protein
MQFISLKERIKNKHNCRYRKTLIEFKDIMQSNKDKSNDYYAVQINCPACLNSVKLGIIYSMGKIKLMIFCCFDSLIVINILNYIAEEIKGKSYLDAFNFLTDSANTSDIPKFKRFANTIISNLKTKIV